MKKLLLALITLAVFASVSAYAAAVNYNIIRGNGIIVEQQQLNPFNPAGIQFTNNFVQLELYNGVDDAIATDPTGSAGVMFVFPLTASIKFNDMLGFRLSLFNPADTASIPAMVGFTRMGPHAVAIPSVTVFSPFAITWGMKAANFGFGVKYELQFAGQGKWADDNYTLAYSKHKLQPGVVFNLGQATLNIIGDFNFVFMNWSVASTNQAAGPFWTNNVTAKSPLELVGVKAQISYPLFGKLLLAGRVEGGLGMFGYDEKYNANTGTQTNDVQASAYYLRIMGGLKYTPIQLVDVYFDLGTKLYGHNKIDNFLGTTTSTNTNVINQITVPSMSMGVAFNPGIFTISVGLSQDIIASSSPISVAPVTLNSVYELEPSATAYTSYQGNTVWTMRRTASAGISMNLNPVILEALFDITQSAFLGQELRNPLDVLDRIFNNAPDMPRLFTGVRCSVLF